VYIRFQKKCKNNKVTFYKKVMEIKRTYLSCVLINKESLINRVHKLIDAPKKR
jgi:hypothetical protein